MILQFFGLQVCRFLVHDVPRQGDKKTWKLAKRVFLRPLAGTFDSISHLPGQHRLS